MEMNFNSIRIVELPRCKMATSGYGMEEDPFVPGGTLMRFADWWGEVDRARADKWFPRDFLMFERQNNALIWFYALPDGYAGEVPFEVVDFEGGLYAAVVSVDEDDQDGERLYGMVKEWTAQSHGFELDERFGHYDLCHVVTPDRAKGPLGFSQLEIYVPIKVKE